MDFKGIGYHYMDWIDSFELAKKLQVPLKA
jgi:hypothetical protein